MGQPIGEVGLSLQDLRGGSVFRLPLIYFRSRMNSEGVLDWGVNSHGLVCTGPGAHPAGLFRLGLISIVPHGSGQTMMIVPPIPRRASIGASCGVAGMTLTTGTEDSTSYWPSASVSASRTI